MIKFLNKTTKLKVDKKALIDANDIINGQMDGVIKEIKNRVNKLSNNHNATVTLSGKINDFVLSVDTESDETATLIEQVVNDYLK
ncbi:hypothetical protein [Dokdonia donghaensis]|uniref:Uncharacterized protein n=1 Tax=Dokdonia donghaensis DSW-1 TaxID=1300343 RepID=A0A0A2GQ99_9FLAO|nr:hypothetical protein [Dokdonia donghaensis]ANH61357.1 hypothetical protein I597_2460 [Dokdonia donghaensis DSW-1]KGO05454.1 hypothetical protein NV36_00400 [Dokdonia donghaensis DSW-1]